MPPRKQPPGSGRASKTTSALPVEEAFDLDGHEFSDIDLEAETSALAGTGTAQKPQSASSAAASKPKKTAAAAASSRKKSEARPRDDEDGANGGKDANMADAEAEEEDAGPNIEDQKAEIPRDLLTRILHGFFARENTRITASANDAVAAYLDTFVREAIVRASDEVEGGAFLEVEDLEKVGPQLLLDL